MKQAFGQAVSEHRLQFLIRFEWSMPQLLACLFLQVNQQMKYAVPHTCATAASVSSPTGC